MNQLITLKNLAPYIPDYPPVEKAHYLKTDEGADWYQAQIHFSPDTRKIAYTEGGRIVFQHTKVHLLWPENLSVSEVPEEDLPAGFPAIDEPCADWIFIDGKVLPKPVNYVLQAENEKAKRVAEAAEIITPLQDAVDLDIATDAELTQLLAWKRYRVMLNRINTSVAPDIEWPARPATN